MQQHHTFRGRCSRWRKRKDAHRTVLPLAMGMEDGKCRTNCSNLLRLAPSWPLRSCVCTNSHHQHQHRHRWSNISSAADVIYLTNIIRFANLILRAAIGGTEPSAQHRSVQRNTKDTEVDTDAHMGKQSGSIIFAPSASSSSG